MRFLLFAVFIGCGGTIAAGDDASTKEAAADAPIPDAAFKSTLSFSNDPGGGDFFGAFYATAEQANDGCQTTKSGSCVVSTCAAVAPQTLANAGTLSLQIGSTSATASQTAENIYFLTPISFAAGDVLAVSNSGGDVPKFSAQITSPGAITISTATPSAISTSQDFTIAWSGGESGASVAVGIARQGFNEALSVSCKFDATAGSGTFP